MELIPRPRLTLGPGAAHVPDWLTLDEQRALHGRCAGWLIDARHTRVPGGGVMSVRTVCLGWHWYPYRYSRTCDDLDGRPVLPFPEWLGELGRRAHQTVYGTDDYHPDTALVNHYDATARMGQHQDRDERSLAPVVSLSLGDTGLFRFGNTETRTKPYTDVELRSGDLVVFGGPSRLAYHGVPRVLPGTAPPGLDLITGRVNITLRESGM